ncbi:MAG: GNAT family N-acetyltransferase [Thermoleophilia bacterium]
MPRPQPQRRSLDVDLVEDDAGLARVRDDWEALAAATRRPGSLPDLLIAWRRHVAPREALTRVVTVRDGGRLVGLAPFLVDRGPLGIAYARMFGTPSLPQRSGILAAPGREEEVVRLVARALAASDPAPGVISLQRIDAGAAAPSLLRRAWPEPLGARLHWHQREPAPVLSLAGRGYDDWLATKGSRTRQKLRRARRRLAERGVAFALAESPAEVAEALDAYRRMHGAHWGDRSRLWREPSMAMLREAAERLVPSGGMRLYLLRTADGIISVEIVLAAGGEAALWNRGWDPAWARESASMVALHDVIEHCFAVGDVRLDLGEKAQPYKLRLSDGDDPVAWATLIPRGRSFPQAVVATAPERWRHRARAAAMRLPDPAVERIKAVRRRLAPA